MYKTRIEWVAETSESEAPGMVTGGYDHNFPWVEHHVDVINTFLTRVALRWPAVIFYLHNDMLQKGTRSALQKGDLPTSIPLEGVVFIVRDEAMDSHEGREGAVPMPDGESSLVLWFCPSRSRPDVHSLDLVTLSDPTESEFCWWAVEQLWDVYLESKRKAPGRPT